MVTLLLIFFLVCMIIQIGFHWVVFDKIPRHKDEHHKHTLPSVSVIVAARNEAAHLPSLLESLFLQEYDDFEVIIVNDRSTDDTAKVLDSYSIKDHRLKPIHIAKLPKDWNGKKYALLQAAKLAKNEILLFTDADCLPESKEWIARMAAAFDPNTDIVLGFSPYSSVPQQRLLSEFISFETLMTGIQYFGFALIKKPYMGVGRNLAFRRKAYDLTFLDKISSLTGGDDDLMVNHIATKKNVRVLLTKKSQMRSVPKSSWRAYIVQKVRHLAAGRHYHKKDQTLLGVFTLSFLFGWILLFLLLVSAINPYLILTAFGLRSLSFYTIFARVGQKFDAHFKIWALPFLDLCYSIYYPVVGVKALATKNIQWK